MRWFVVRPLFLVFVVLSTGLASFSYGQTLIQLRSQVKLDRRDISLDDIAIIRSSSLEKLEMLMALPVGRYVSSAPSVDLDRGALAQWVARHGPDVGALDWRGAERIHLAFSAPSSGRDCVPQTQSMMRAWLAKRYSRYEISMFVPGEALLTGQQCHVRAFDEAQIPMSRMTVWGDIFEGTRFVRSVAMLVKVSAFKDVWLARVPISAGEPVHASMFVHGTVDVARENVALVQTGWEKGGFRAVRAMRVGQILTSAMLAASPDVERGGQAVMTARVGAVQLEATVQVLQDGMKGARIPVRVGSGRSMLARVVSQGRLEAIE